MPMSTLTQSGFWSNTSVCQRAFRSRTRLPLTPMFTNLSRISGIMQVYWAATSVT